MMTWLKSLAGRFIVFDGPDGSGKTTQFNRFADACHEAGVPVCEVREPGGTAIGEQVRAVLLDPANESMNVRCEMLLYMASRAQLVEEKIAPALHRGEIVLADRFVSSTLAYQGRAGGIPRDVILAVAECATSSLQPDLIVIFDVDEETATGRMGSTRDRMERKGVEFQREVRAGYMDQDAASPGQYIVIDASGDEDAVHVALMQAMMAWCDLDHGSAGG